MLYTEKDLEKSLDRIEVVNFHQEVEVGGVRFWAYTAGHVLGAAMFMIEIAGVKVSWGEGRGGEGRRGEGLAKGGEGRGGEGRG